MVAILTQFTRICIYKSTPTILGRHSKLQRNIELKEYKYCTSEEATENSVDRLKADGCVLFDKRVKR